MALNLSQLANNIIDSVKGIGAELGLIADNSAALYPSSFSKITSETSGGKNWNKLPFPYTFAVVDIVNPESRTLFQDFALPISPSSITQSEDFAISIKPTQGGTVTTHSGNKYKTLSISGTTGINPFRGLAGVDQTTGRAIAKPNQIKYKSGQEVFLELRNWFKVYYQYKAQNLTTFGKNYRLVFKNFKDGEFLIVELLKFTMKRTAERSLLYDYEMEFKVLSHLKFTNPKLDDFAKFDEAFNKIVQKIDTARGIFLRSQEIIRNIESTYDSAVLEPLRKISLATKALAGIPITAADAGNRIIKNTATEADALNILQNIKEQQEQAAGGQSEDVPDSILSKNLPSDLKSSASNDGASAITSLDDVLLDVPLNALPQSTLDAIPNEINDNLANPRSFYEESRESLKRVKQNAEDKFNLGSSVYDELFNRVSTTTADSSKLVTAEEFEVLNGFNEAISAINLLLSTQDLFKSQFSDRIDDLQSRFIDQISLQNLPTVRQLTLVAGVDLEQIALEELGDATRWPEIAELNDLKSPYITQNPSDTRTNILKPGDTFLIPQEITFGLATTPPTKDITSTSGLSEIEKSFATDLKITDKYDISLGNNSDIEVISGSPNFAQGIVLKLLYEKGEVRKDPSLGVGIQIGSKFITIEQFRDNIVSTLQQDNRVDNVSKVQLLRDNNVLYISFEVKPKNVDIPIPLTIQL